MLSGPIHRRVGEWGSSDAEDGNVSEIVEINLEKNSATFNNFMLQACVNPE